MRPLGTWLVSGQFLSSKSMDEKSGSASITVGRSRLGDFAT